MFFSWIFLSTILCLLGESIVYDLSHVELRPPYRHWIIYSSILSSAINNSMYSTIISFSSTHSFSIPCNVNRIGILIPFFFSCQMLSRQLNPLCNRRQNVDTTTHTGCQQYDCKGIEIEADHSRTSKCFSWIMKYTQILNTFRYQIL